MDQSKGYTGNVLRLRGTNKGNVFLVLQSEASEKDAGDRRETVTPLSVAEFDEKDLLSMAPEEPLEFRLFNGFQDSRGLHRHQEGAAVDGTVEAYLKDRLLAVGIPSDPIIDSYRVLEILGVLPRIEGSTANDIRQAEALIQAYDQVLVEQDRPGIARELKEVFGGIPFYTFGKGGPNVDYMVTFVELSRQYEEKMGGRQKLAEILKSLPCDSFGNEIAPDGTVYLAISSDSFPQEELDGFLRSYLK
ncbi:MAG: hypothetical protein ACE5FW_01830 [Candidatus Aenigmatarchaeota archaeon]